MMVKLKDRFTLSRDQIQTLREYLPESFYNRDADVVYKGHVPHVGLVLVDGNMFLQKSRKNEAIKVGEVHGVQELVENEPSRYTLKVESGSTVLILDRSTLSELKNSSDPRVREIMQSLLNREED